VAAKHRPDRRIQSGGDAGADLVGGGQEVEPGPARCELVDERDRLVDPEAVGLGVEDAGVEPAPAAAVAM
jgi:hypothetical protein